MSRKIPQKLRDVRKEIEIHPEYNTLDMLTLMQYEECSKETINIMKQPNNKFIRDLWKHLYNNEEKPF